MSLTNFSSFLLALCIYREARGTSTQEKEAVGCSIRNRVDNPRWWGRDWLSVITCKYQYSSFNQGDPNNVIWPKSWDDPQWIECCEVALGVIAKTIPDPTGGADSYYDKSLDVHPPSWTTGKTATLITNFFRFYKTI